MFSFVEEGSEITPGIRIDKEHRILFLMIATYQHRWCFRFRWRKINDYNGKRFTFTKTHWTLDDDIHSYLYQHGLTPKQLDLGK